MASHATHYLKLSYAMKGILFATMYHVDTANRELDFLNAKDNLYSIPLGRFGLFFVFSKFDVPEVIRGHRKRSEEHPGFLDELQRDYDRYGKESSLCPCISVLNITHDAYVCMCRYLISLETSST